MNIEQKELIQYGEPPLGSIYDQKEVQTVNRVLLESMRPNVGFYAERETSEFESEFSKLCNTKYAIAFNGAGGALDLLVRSLHTEGDEIISCSLNFPGTHLAIIGNGAKLVLCERDKAKEVISAIKKVHPYEEVALDILLSLRTNYKIFPGIQIWNTLEFA